MSIYSAESVAGRYLIIQLGCAGMESGNTTELNGGRISVNVLIIDDSPELLERLSRAVREHGFGCWAFSDSEAAVGIIGNEYFDIVITDMIMPGLSGTRVIDAVREKSPGSFIIAISGNMDPGIRSSALSHGADVFMHKPLDLFVLLDELTRASARLDRPD